MITVKEAIPHLVTGICTEIKVLGQFFSFFESEIEFKFEVIVIPNGSMERECKKINEFKKIFKSFGIEEELTVEHTATAFKLVIVGTILK